jgi:hypothetical protein
VRPKSADKSARKIFHGGNISIGPFRRVISRGVAGFGGKTVPAGVISGDFSRTRQNPSQGLLKTLRPDRLLNCE